MEPLKSVWDFLKKGKNFTIEHRIMQNIINEATKIIQEQKEDKINENKDTNIYSSNLSISWYNTNHS